MDYIPGQSDVTRVIGYHTPLGRFREASSPKAREGTHNPNDSFGKIYSSKDFQMIYLVRIALEISTSSKDFDEMLSIDGISLGVLRSSPVCRENQLQNLPEGVLCLYHPV